MRLYFAGMGVLAGMVFRGRVAHVAMGTVAHHPIETNERNNLTPTNQSISISPIHISTLLSCYSGTDSCSSVSYQCCLLPAT